MSHYWIRRGKSIYRHHKQKDHLGKLIAMLPETTPAYRIDKIVKEHNDFIERIENELARFEKAVR